MPSSCSTTGAAGGCHGTAGLGGGPPLRSLTSRLSPTPQTHAHPPHHPPIPSSLKALDGRIYSDLTPTHPPPSCSLKALADVFALDRIYSDLIFRNDDYIAPEKVGLGWLGGLYVDVLGCGRMLHARPAPHPSACPPPAPCPRCQAKAISRLIEALCGELRGVAVPLVDAFAVSEGYRLPCHAACPALPAS